ncbi:hypothetical protein J437_LFUL013248 [Ladona fulva]|uniref:PiggyBac transposable element-derived protein domain-containing protein n=1 Tax=Ladona fulva TaxID=123851 RepID=A0A8K0KIM0_LADFU|nr:hypothetical protein J437_LFUL013248 [Ladona fulva]
MEKFLGLLFHVGNIKLNKIQDYWRKDDLYDQPTFAKVKPRDRFLLILRSIQFGRNAREGEHKPIDPLFILKNVGKVYYPFKNLSLDESLVLWRGRLSFRQFILNKRHHSCDK